MSGASASPLRPSTSVEEAPPNEDVLQESMPPDEPKPPGPSTSVPDGRALPSLAPRNLSASMSGFVPNQSVGSEAQQLSLPTMPGHHALLYHSLAALQKLSLKRAAQSAMIREGLLPWIVDFLLGASSAAEEMSAPVTEYACALLMNLSLRTAGRNDACIGLARPLRGSNPDPAEEARSSSEQATGAAASQNPGGAPGSSSVASRLLKLCENLIESKNDQVCLGHIPSMHF